MTADLDALAARIAEGFDRMASDGLDPKLLAAVRELVPVGLQDPPRAGSRSAHASKEQSP